MKIDGSGYGNGHNGMDGDGYGDGYDFGNGRGGGHGNGYGNGKGNGYGSGYGHDNGRGGSNRSDLHSKTWVALFAGDDMPAAVINSLTRMEP